MADMNRILEVEMCGQRRQVVGIVIHVMAVPGLAGAPVSPTVVSNHGISAFAEEQHLCVPIIGGQWPAVAKYHGLTLAPILVKDLRSIFRCNRRHGNSPCVFKSARIVDFAGLQAFRASAKGLESQISFRTESDATRGNTAEQYTPVFVQ